MDCNNLLPMSLKNGTTDVLNGIAYNPLTKSIYVTGKYWPKMYRIELVEK
ncbi:MAG: glutaminyl-peptide cyclotransferase [Bacteroidales bacterium]